ncbi:RDD family protein [Bacillus timonensis]|nr:RDD family protein [Bacillus timonensis]
MEYQEERVEYAGFGARFGAYLLDAFILGIPLFILFFVLSIVMIGSTAGFEELMASETMEAEISDEMVASVLGYYLVVLLLALIVPVAYYAGFHASPWQATVGKKIVGLKVTDLNGNRISFWRGFGRYLAMSFLSGIFMIGYIMALFTEKKQALHDLIAGTVVVRK